MEIKSILRNAGVPHEWLKGPIKWGKVYPAYFQGPHKRAAEIMPIERKFGWQVNIRVSNVVCRIRCINGIVKIQTSDSLFAEHWLGFKNLAMLRAMLRKKTSTNLVLLSALKTFRPLRTVRTEPPILGKTKAAP